VWKRKRDEAWVMGSAKIRKEPGEEDSKDLGWGKENPEARAVESWIVGAKLQM
jgi:hypothetical protein